MTPSQEDGYTKENKVNKHNEEDKNKEEFTTQTLKAHTDRVSATKNTDTPYSCVLWPLMN